MCLGGGGGGGKHFDLDLCCLRIQLFSFFALHIQEKQLCHFDL